MNTHYPFAAIVGQEALKTALLLCAVNPGIGGVLIRGEKGTAKSTVARGLSEILPPIERVPDCAFNCAPGEACSACEVCGKGDTLARPAPVPFISLPLGATEDRVLGSLDFERALRDGAKAFQPGLLAAAHRGILYIDEVNLLADHLVDVLLDVAAMGVNSIQREGLSVTHPARLMLIGTMNLEEGDLRPQLLDRFGMMVDVQAPRDPELRAEVVRRRIAFEADPQGFCDQWAAEQELLRRKVLTATQLLPSVKLDDDLLTFISMLCCELEVNSLRADIVMHKVARTLAALDGRDAATPHDVRRAAELALPHRRRRKPFEQAGLDQERLDQLMNEAYSYSPSPDREEQPAEMDDSRAENPDAAAEADAGDEIFGVASQGAARRIEIASDMPRESAGRRSSAPEARRGRYVKAVPSENAIDLAVNATLRHAVLRNSGELKVSRADLHRKIRVGKHGNLILFVVDASGSMAARKRMQAVKGAVVCLLADAYQRRDEVGVIAFRGPGADLMLPPTRSVELAEQRLRDLATGGRTPLPHALELAARTLVAMPDKDRPEPLLVVLSDGKANVSLDGGDPWQETLELASRLAELGVKALVLDTEDGYVRLGRAQTLAQRLGAEYLPLEDLSAEGLTLKIRGHLNDARAG